DEQEEQHQEDRSDHQKLKRGDATIVPGHSPPGVREHGHSRSSHCLMSAAPAPAATEDGSPSATNRSTGAVTTSVILMIFHGTSEGARPETVIRTVVAVLPRDVADTWVRKPGTGDLAKAAAAAAPSPGGGLDVLATSAPC